MLIGGQAAGQAGDGIAQIAFAQVILFTVGEGATPSELTKLFAATLLPYSMIGPIAGIAIDRWDRRRVMVAAALFRAGLAALAPLAIVWRSQTLAYLLVILLLSASRFVLAGKGAAIPLLVRSDLLVRTNAISSIAGLVSAFVGAVVAAPFAARHGSLLFWIGTVAYSASAATFSRLGDIGGRGGVAADRKLFLEIRRQLAEERRAVFDTPAVRIPLESLWAHRFLLGAGFVVLVVVADYRFGLEAPGYALALGATGVAAFVGSIFAPMVIRKVGAAGAISFGFGMGAAGAGISAVFLSLPGAIAGVAIAAFAFQNLKINVDTLVQEGSADTVRGRVFSVYDVLYNLAFIAAALVLIPIWSPGRERALFSVICGFFAMGALWFRRRAVPVLRPKYPTVALGERRWMLRLVALVAGMLPFLVFPRPSIWPLAWVALVPLMSSVARSGSGREAGIRAWLGGAGYFLAVHFWLFPKVGVFMFVVAVVFGLFWIPWGVALEWSLRLPVRAGRLCAGLGLAAAAWVSAEYLRSWDQLGGAWAIYGTSLWKSPAQLASVSVGGVWLASFILVLANLSVTVALLRATSWQIRVASAAVALFLFAASPAYWALRGDPFPGPSLRVTGIQPGDIKPADERFDASLGYTRSLPTGASDLIVWSESSVGTDPFAEPRYMEEIIGAARVADAPILVNVDARQGEAISKTSILVTPDGPEDSYTKMRLVPFGEYVPLRPLFGWISNVTDAAAEDRRRGDALTTIETGGAVIGPLVCFESSFPDMTRVLARRGAELIVFQSATTTFQESWAPDQHASLGAVRAAETGRPVFHATQSGTSAAFDESGRLLVWRPTDFTGAYSVDMTLASRPTPYVRWGDWLPVLCLLALVLAGGRILVAAMRRPQRKTGSRFAANAEIASRK